MEPVSRDPLPSDPLPNVPCVILAGGRSRRFGSNKALARLGGIKLYEWIVRALQDQTSGPIAINSAEHEDVFDETHTVLRDELPDGLGPLVGIHAAMVWGRALGVDAVVTVPVDAPILPEDYIAKLLAAGAPAVSKYSERTHLVHGIWPVHLSEDLAAAVQNGTRAVHEWTARIGARKCPFPQRPNELAFFNINTPQDLERLQQAHLAPRG